MSRAAAALRALGIRRGDRVGIFLPMTLECAIATLACSRIGAIYTPIFSGYAAPAVASRLNDCTARLLITADGFFRRGRVVPLKEVADAAARAAPSVERLLVVQRRRVERTYALAAGPRCMVARPGSAATGHAARCGNRGQRAVHADLYIGHHRTAEGGGTRPRRLSDQGRARTWPTASTSKADDRVWWYTDLGWMMGPWLIAGTLLLGATVFLYDGAPDWPAPDRLWGYDGAAAGLRPWAWPRPACGH